MQQQNRGDFQTHQVPSDPIATPIASRRRVHEADCMISR